MSNEAAVRSIGQLHDAHGNVQAMWRKRMLRKQWAVITIQEKHRVFFNRKLKRKCVSLWRFGAQLEKGKADFARQQ